MHSKTCEKEKSYKQDNKEKEKQKLKNSIVIHIYTHSSTGYQQNKVKNRYQVGIIFF